MLYRPDEAIPHTEVGLGQEKDVIPDSDIAHPGDPTVPELSHTLRTRLAVITLLSGNLDLLYESLDDEKRRAMIKDLRKQMHSLNALASELLLQQS